MTDNQIQINQYSQPAVVGRVIGPVKKEETDSDFSDLFSSAVGANAAQQPTDMDEIFSRAAEQYHVPVSLLKAVAKVESGFDADAVSSSGAQGVMQLMPSTAASMGVQNPLDAEQNIMAGARYLSQKIGQYDGDVTLALAAYNAGSGNVAKYGGVPPFKETQTYISRVMNYAGMPLDAPEISTATLPDSLASLNAMSSLGSLGALTSLAGGSSDSGLNTMGTLLGSLPSAAPSGTPQTAGYTYGDYLSFLQLWAAQMQSGIGQPLASDLSGLTDDEDDGSGLTL
jgi:Soluble lytic murein transglycosylase and related regulatory proteins (some contain LysM/invasin domains)